MSISIQNKVALVTGANRGIGKAIVESFLAHGASKVYLAVRELASTAELQQKYGEKVLPLVADVADNASIEALATQTQDVQVVVNNAGILEVAQPLDAHMISAFEKELRVNVYGLIHVAQAFAPILEKNRGALVQLNSVASVKTFPEFTSYCASKAATYSITQGLRDTLGPKGVQVLSVHPGPIETRMATKAGFAGNGEPVSAVSEGIVKALAAGDFHLFPDNVSQGIWAAYQSFAATVVEAQEEEAA